MDMDQNIAELNAAGKGLELAIQESNVEFLLTQMIEIKRIAMRMQKTEFWGIALIALAAVEIEAQKN